jgi:5'-nucleotidase
LFSGDFFFPSNLSTFFEGKQMIKPFNRLNINASCLGNHELEIGIEHGAELIKQTNCPWLMSNLVELDKDSKPVAGCESYTILES